MKLAERVGFEPTVPGKEDTRFPGVPDRPLWHLSNLLTREFTLADNGGNIQSK